MKNYFFLIMSIFFDNGQNLRELRKIDVKTSLYRFNNSWRIGEFTFTETRIVSCSVFLKERFRNTLFSV